MAVNYLYLVISIVVITALITNAYAIELEQKKIDPPKNGSYSIKTDKDFYRCDERAIIKITGKPNTTYTIIVQKPDGSSVTLTVTTNASGNGITSLLITPPSGVWLLMLYEKDVIVAKWEFKVDCEKIPPPPKDNCFTIVSNDKMTWVDRGNTVPATTYSGWPVIPGATYVWSSNGLDTNNAYTFTQHFLLPQGYAYSGTIYINADDQWLDLKINNVFIASESFPGWGNVHNYTVTSLQPGLNTIEVKAVDIGGAYAGLAFKLDIKCKPMPSSIHWDKIIFTISINNPTQNNVTNANLKSLLGKTLDIKVRDDPSDVAILEDKVKAFLAAKYNLTKQEVDKVNIRIINVEYAIDTNVHAYMKAEPQKPEQQQSATKNSTMSNEIYYILPLLSTAAILMFWYRKRKG